MLAHSKIFVAVLFAFGSLCAQAAKGPGDAVEIQEILALLRAGVPSQEILATMARRGDPRGVTEADLSAVRAAGGDGFLVDRLTARLETFQRLAALSRQFEVHSELESGLDFLVPKGKERWDVQIERGDGSVLVAMEPDVETRGTWFAKPRVLLWMTPYTNFPASATQAIGDRLGSIARRRLAVQGFTPGLAIGRPADVALGVGREVRLAARAPETGFEGQVILRTRVLANGTVLLAAMAVSDADAAKAEPLFDEIARSVEISRRR